MYIFMYVAFDNIRQQDINRKEGGMQTMGNPYWTMKYQQMIKTVPQNKSEEIALRLLNQGSGVIEAMNGSGLCFEEFEDLMKRADKFECEKLCVRKESSDLCFYDLTIG